MTPISYARRRVQPDVIRHSVWLHLRFRLSYRDVSYETIRRCVLIRLTFTRCPLFFWCQVRIVTPISACCSL